MYTDRSRLQEVSVAELEVAGKADSFPARRMAIDLFVQLFESKPPGSLNRNQQCEYVEERLGDNRVKPYGLWLSRKSALDQIDAELSNAWTRPGRKSKNLSKN